MNFFLSYIKPHQVKNIDSYKYSSSGQGFLDPHLNKWWNFVTELTPHYVAPNILTLLGFICTIISCALNWVVFNFELPAYLESTIFFLIALLVFAYQTFDAMDGKQARRINHSSPLGQLLDHGCDGLATMILTHGVAQLVGLQFTVAQYIIFTSQFYCFYFMWWDLHFHVFRCSMSFISVTELQMMVSMAYIFAGTFGLEVFRFRLADIPPNIYGNLSLPIWVKDLKLLEIYMIVFVTWMLIYLMIEVCRESPNLNQNNAKSQLFMQLTHQMIQIVFAYTPVAIRLPNLVFLLLSINHGIIMLRIMVSSIFKVSCGPIHYPLVPFYCCSVFLIYSMFTTKEEGPYDFFILFCVLFWQFIYYMNFIQTMSSVLCDHLSIYMWKVGRKTKKTQ